MIDPDGEPRPRLAWHALGQRPGKSIAFDGAGDLFVHLLTGIHHATGALGPTRIAGMGGQRYWNDGRDVYDVIMGLLDYPKTEARPGFTLSLQTNF